MVRSLGWGLGIAQAGKLLIDGDCEGNRLAVSISGGGGAKSKSALPAKLCGERVMALVLPKAAFR